jgi:hypothetical protein
MRTTVPRKNLRNVLTELRKMPKFRLLLTRSMGSLHQVSSLLITNFLLATNRTAGMKSLIKESILKWTVASLELLT